jgi:hypothetical protein
MLLGCCLHSFFILYFMFPLRCRQADNVPSPVSHKIIAGVVVTHDKFSPVLLLAIYYRRCPCYQGKVNRWYHGIDENP